MEELNEYTAYGKCRCCLAIGTHRDLKKEYLNNGTREIYYETFIDCFNLFLSTSPHIPPLICSSCIYRLQDANNFKTLVINTEKALLNVLSDGETRSIGQHCDPLGSFVNVPVANLDCNQSVKTEFEDEVKLERDDYDDNTLVDNIDIRTNFVKYIDTNIVPHSNEKHLLDRFPKGSLKPLPTRRTMYKICPKYVWHLDALKANIDHQENEEEFEGETHFFLNEKYPETKTFAYDSSDEYQPSPEEGEESRSNSDGSFCDSPADNITPSTTKDSTDQAQSNFISSRSREVFTISTFTEDESPQPLTTVFPQNTKQHEHKESTFRTPQTATEHELQQPKTYILPHANTEPEPHQPKSDIPQNTIQQESCQLNTCLITQNTSELESHQSRTYIISQTNTEPGPHQPKADIIPQNTTEQESCELQTYLIPQNITVESCKAQVDVVPQDKVITGRSIERNILQTSKRTKNNTLYITEKLAHAINVCTILENSNAVAFKTKIRSGFPCFYCRQIYESMDALREHQITHPKGNLFKLLTKYKRSDSLVVYADVTNLKCSLCNTDVKSLLELKGHLKVVHKKRMYDQFTDRVIPFKLVGHCDYECQMCGFNFETFGAIERHMNVHYRNYVCEKCGAGFITNQRLKVHTYTQHREGTYPCEKCKKIFPTYIRFKVHYEVIHNHKKPNKCTKCSERFIDYFTRQKHMVEKHGMKPILYKCKVCEKSFGRRYSLSIHQKRCHLDEKDVKCDLCLYTCFSKSELRAHMLKHGAGKLHECAICKKSYARKKTLKEHMRIHNNDKRFVCALCEQAFVQNCSLKQHLKAHHGDQSSY